MLNLYVRADYNNQLHVHVSQYCCMVMLDLEGPSLDHHYSFIWVKCTMVMIEMHDPRGIRNGM